MLVRNAPGLAFRTRASLPAAELAALYDAADLAASSQLHATHAHLRLYLCRCSRWLENDASACEEPDPDSLTDPDMPWGCDGHPSIQLPHDIDGLKVSSHGELRDLATRGFHGFHTPRTRPADMLHAAWLVRLHARLQPADAGVVATAARSCLEDPDPRTRALALQFFWRVTDEAAQTRLLAILEGDRRLFAGILDEVTAFPNFDRTLEESMWRVLGPLVAAPGRARDLARAEALSPGKGGRALYDALARGDSVWVVSSAEDIARATPDRAEDLSGSFAQLPPTVPIGAVRERIAKALVQPAHEAIGPITFEQALAQPRSLLAAWDFKDPDDDNLGLYTAGASGAKRVASKTISAADREEMNEKLRQKDVRIGGAYTYTQHVWVMDDDGFAVWNSNALLAEGSRGELKLRGRKVRARDITRVVTFVDSGNIGLRGVRCELADYTAVIAVEEVDQTPQLDPFYDNDTLDDNMGWAVFLGFELAMWLSVPWVDRFGNVKNEKHLQLAGMFRELADQIEKLPDHGDFAHVERALGSFADARDASLRYAPNPLEPDRRFLELKVWTADGKGWRGRWIKQGTNKQVAAYLRHFRTPHTVWTNTGDLARKLASGNEFS